MAAPWEKALPWLCEDGHKSTAGEAAELQDYFKNNPEQVELPDTAFACIPLHRAAYKQRGKHAVVIVKTLLAAYPDGVKQKNKYGDLPLHDAAWRQTGEHGVTIVKLLLTLFPAGAKQKDTHGALPADYAERHNTSLPDACKAMLRSAAQGKWQAEAQGTRFFSVSFLLHYVCKVGNE
jgi:ankyrin repeat protein